MEHGDTHEKDHGVAQAFRAKGELVEWQAHIAGVHKDRGQQEAAQTLDFARGTQGHADGKPGDANDAEDGEEHLAEVTGRDGMMEKRGKHKAGTGQIDEHIGKWLQVNLAHPCNTVTHGDQSENREYRFKYSANYHDWQFRLIGETCQA